MSKNLGLKGLKIGRGSHRVFDIGKMNKGIKGQVDIISILKDEVYEKELKRK